MPLLFSCFFLSFLLYLLRSLAQSIGGIPGSSVPAEKCGANQFFSIELAQCAPCGQKLTRSPDALRLQIPYMCNLTQGVKCRICVKGYLVDHSFKLWKKSLRCICVAGHNETKEQPHPPTCPDCSNVAPNTLWESMFLEAAFLDCNNTCNATACQILTNMVILEAFTLENRAYDLYTKTKNQDIPKLWYDAPGRPFPAVSFRKSSKMDFKATKYDLRGKFLGWEDLRGGTLQLCPGSHNALEAAFVFGTSYSHSCTLDVSSLLRSIPEPLFYEMFLQFDDEQGHTYLWPIPVDNPAILTNNQAFPNSRELRRFFLVDGVSGREANLTNAPASVTLAAELLLSISLPINHPRDNSPFRLMVKYARRSNSGVTQVSFSVSYLHDPGAAQQATNIAFGVLGSLALLYALLETSSWARRSRLPNINFTLVVQFLAYLAGSLANVFFVVTLGIGIYWLIVFKGQQGCAVEVMLPAAGSQIETSFISYVLCGLVLKALDIVHILISQVRVSIFMIDWERPKEKQMPKGSAGYQGADPCISAWRTFLIANEWNEIQTHRKVHPSFQLFAVLLLLEVVGLKNLTSRDLNLNLHPEPDAYHAPRSPILRFGIAASIWLAVGLLQVVASLGFYERFVEDKIHQFIDLCSLSNVSVFILTHRCYGFYIHGRSVHGNADVDMETMISYLRKEEANLCPLRGLEAHSDVQTFEVLFTERTRAFYDRITLTLMEVPSGTHVRPDLQKQRMKSYHALNRFLIAFLEHRYKDMDYVVKDKFFLERIMDMEFQEPGDVSILYNDDRAFFSRTLFYGHELALLLFETLLFCAVDLAAKDFVLATIVTFVVQKLVQIVRRALGRQNLAEKTLVEKQFLI